MRKLLPILAAPLVATADLKTDLGLEAGDFVALSGDSITAPHMYSGYLATWFYLNYPADDFVVPMLARSGSSTYSWRTEEYEKRVYVLDPDVVFLMLGHNDGSDAAAQKSSTETLISDWIVGNYPGDAAAGVSSLPVLIGAHPTSSADGKPVLGSFNTNYQEIAEAATPDYLYSHTWNQLSPIWIYDFNANTPNELVNEPGDVGGYDAVHCSRTGHILIAWSALKGLGVVDNENLVSSAVIAADTQTEISSTDCTISNISANAYSGVDFDRLDARLPWAIDESGRADAETLIPGSTTWQDYLFTVTGLSSGTYDIYCDDELVTSATSAALAAGVDLAGVTQGPVWQQGQDTLTVVRTRLQGLDPDTLDVPNPPWTGVTAYNSDANNEYSNNGLRGDALRAELSDWRPYLVNRSNNEIAPAAEPVTRTWSIRNQEAGPAWEYVGIPYTDWGYDPVTEPGPEAPPEWPEAESLLFFYVAADDPNATDTVGAGDTTYGGLRRGWPDKPRKTLPVWSGVNNNYTAGMVIWVKGGFYDDVRSGSTSWRCQFAGTEENICWIYGDPDDRPTFGNFEINTFNTQNLIVANIDWVNSSATATCFSTGNASGDGDSNKITVRDCTVTGRRFYQNSSYFPIQSSTNTGTAADADVSNVMLYNIIFKDCGRGSDFNSGDADGHGIKVDGQWLNGGVEQNTTSRVWIIDCQAQQGDTPDTDGFYKSVAGSFVQLGDQQADRGGIHHIYIAGNEVHGVRQSTVGVKRCGPAIISSNRSYNTASSSSANGQAFNAKYDRRGQSEGPNTGEGIWFVNNLVDGAHSAMTNAEMSQGQGNDTHTHADGRVYLFGNVFRNIQGRDGDTNVPSPSLGSWKSSGIALHDRSCPIFIANNTMDKCGYGVVTAGNSRDSPTTTVQIYNNIFTDLGDPLDPLAGDGVSVFNNDGGSVYYVENNMVDAFAMRYTSTTYSEPSVYNSRADANGNLEDDPLYTSSASGDYSLTQNSPAIDTATNPTTLAPVAPFDIFISSFANDPDFPGDPADVWPRSYLNSSRFEGVGLDIGAYEYGATTPPLPGGEGSIITNTLSTGTFNIGQ